MKMPSIRTFHPNVSFFFAFQMSFCALNSKFSYAKIDNKIKENGTPIPKFGTCIPKFVRFHEFFGENKLRLSWRQVIVFSIIAFSCHFVFSKIQIQYKKPNSQSGISLR